MSRRLADIARRRIAAICTVAVGLALVLCQAAVAKYRGSDVLGNLSPESLLGDGSLADRYPLSAYALDTHVDVGLSELDGVPAMIAHWAAAQLWSLTSFLVRTVIDVFTWAFSLDLLGGNPDRGGEGAIGPVAAAISSLYENVIGEAWMVAAITLAGVWGIWKALVQRRYTQTAASLGVSICFVLVALFFVYQPERTIGQASQWANQLSLAFLSGASRGTVDDPAKAKRQVADQLFAAQVMAPWLALNFGGTRHCVDTKHPDQDGFPRPVSPRDPDRNVCRDHLRQGRDGYGGYAPRFLRHPAGSHERDAEYEALNEGQAPDVRECLEGDDGNCRDPEEFDKQFSDYRVDKADAPAVDIQQAGGAYQRLTLAILIFGGSLGMVFLLGFLALAVVLAQIVALVLLAFAPVALVVGVFPGAGHDLFRSWLARLGTAVFIKAVYSLVIAVVTAVSAALGQATGSLGFLFAFGLQAVFFWAIFLYRKQLTARLVGATAGRYDAGPIRTAANRGADMASRPFAALTALPGRGTTDSKRQESALGGNDAATPAGMSGPPGVGNTDRPDDGSSSTPRTQPPRPGPRAPGGGLRPPRPDRGPDGFGTAAPIPNGNASESEISPHHAPRHVAEPDAMRRARELRDRQDHELRNETREEPTP